MAAQINMYTGKLSEKELAVFDTIDSAFARSPKSEIRSPIPQSPITDRRSLLPNVLLLLATCFLLLFPLDIFSQGFPTSRDAWEWPFDAQSIWNMPIGSDAQYMHANLDFGLRTFIDEEVIEIIPAGSPTRRLYAPGSWEVRCSDTRSPTGNPNDSVFIPIPDDFIVPDTDPPWTPNNSAALLQPDGRTVISIGPMARCDTAGLVYGWYASVDDLYNDGYFGSHGGSGLSALGGSIRLGEMVGPDPIRHVIKINIWGERYMMYDPNSPTPGYRWPARQTDSYAGNVYGGTNPELVLGALMAIPPNLTPNDLNIQTIPGQKLFYALQDYGAYIVDDTAWDVTAFCMEYGVIEEMELEYGFTVRTHDTTSAWYQDYYRLVCNLHIITNNAAGNIGGGGTPRQPLAPPFETLTSLERPVSEIPQTFSLEQNYPNPFNLSTQVRYNLKEPSDTVLTIYDLQGREVRRFEAGTQQAGTYTVTFSAEGRASGVYLYRLKVGESAQTRKMLLIR